MAEYATANGDWDWERLGQVLPKDWLDILMSLKPLNVFVGPDQVAWFPIVSGDFNLKSAYSVQFDRDSSSQSQLFKELWKIKSPQRLKMSMWVVVNNALLTNHARVRRVLSLGDTCILCGRASETTLHALRNCIYAKELWKSIGHSFITNSFFQQPLLL